MVDRLTGVAVPNNGGLPLVSDPDRGNLIWRDLRLDHYIRDH